MPQRMLTQLALALVLAACGDDGQRPLGASCTADSQCTSGLCVQSVCLDPAADEDLDGLTNRVEGALGTNPLLMDSDGDGKLDPSEIDLALLVNRDSDGDGKPDALESAILDADDDCLFDELDPADGVPDPSACGALRSSCSALYRSGRPAPSGDYVIDPDGEGPEAGIAVECLMDVAAGGWTRLGAEWLAWLERAPIAPAPAREYLYLLPSGAWYRTAPTLTPWSWSRGGAAPGVWFLRAEDGSYDSLDCGREATGIGLSCAGGPTLMGLPGGEASATAELCLASSCVAVVVYVRDQPCPGLGDNLLADGGFDAFVKGQPSCWRIPLAQPPDRPGAGVAADIAGARPGAAPALYAARFDADGAWLTSLAYDSVAVSARHGYRLSFWARAMAPRPLFALSGAAGKLEEPVLSLSDGWRAYELGFVPGATQLDARPTILFGQVDGDVGVWLDDVALVDLGPLSCTPPEGELLGDGAFNGGTACWIAVPWREGAEGAASGRFLSDPDAPIPSHMPSLRVDHDLPAAGSGPELAQVSAAPLVAGHGYELTLDAKGAGEVLLVHLGSWRANGLPTDSEHPLLADWSQLVLRWDVAPEQVDPSGAVISFEPISPGPGTLWLDNARLVDLGADPCQPGVWVARGYPPDGDFDFGLRCWSVSAFEGTRVEARPEGAAPPALYTSNSNSTAEVIIASTPFDLAAGSYTLEIAARMSGQRSLGVELVDADGAPFAMLPIDLGDGWIEQALPFEVKVATRVTLRLRSYGYESGELWVDGLLILPGGG